MMGVVLYFIILLLIAFLGLWLVLEGLRKPRRVLLVVAGLMLIALPYPADLIFTRIVHMGESPKTAWLPTTIVLSALEPKADGTYVVIFDRHLKAPPRHAFFAWQEASYADWCLACVRSGDAAMIKRGVQISAKLGVRHDAAVLALGEALEVGNAEVRTLACQILMGLGTRAGIVQPMLERAAASKVEALRDQAQRVLDQLKSLSSGG